MNVSAAVLAITLCLEAQQHHSSLAEEIPTVPFALGFFPGPPSQHTFPHVCSTRFNSACPLSAAASAAASASFPVAFCFPHATVCSPWLCLPQQREEAGISSQGELMVWLSCNRRWVERTRNNSHPIFMAIGTKHFRCYLGVCYSKNMY